MLRSLIAICLLAPAGTARATGVPPGVADTPAALLREAAQAFAGAPVRLDGRIAVPGCEGGHALRWLSAARTELEASCLQNGWRLRLPVLAVAPAAVPRRGQIVQVEALGQGYRASVEAVVESVDGREGVLGLRNSRSGRRFTATVGPDGRIYSGRGEQR